MPSNVARFRQDSRFDIEHEWELGTDIYLRQLQRGCSCAMITIERRWSVFMPLSLILEYDDYIHQI